MKKRRSAKQKANDRRLGRMAKARARKTTTRKRRTTRKGMLTLKNQLIHSVPKRQPLVKLKACTAKANHPQFQLQHKT